MDNQSNKVNTVSIDRESVTSDLDRMLDSIISKGVVEDEREIVPGLRLKLKALSTEEVWSAESMVAIANNPMMPVDVIQRARSVSILVAATVALNGVAIRRPDLSPEDVAQRQSALHRKYVEMPPGVIDKMTDFYFELVKKQNNLFKEQLSEKNLSETVENF